LVSTDTSPAITGDWGIIISGPNITSGTLASDNTYVDVLFSEGVYSTNGGSGALDAADFNIIFAQNGGTATNAAIAGVTNTSGGTLTGGESTIRVNLTITGIPSGVETVELRPIDGNSIFNAAGGAAITTETTGALALYDQATPQIAGASLASDNSSVDVQLSEGAFNTSGGSGALQISDFTLTFVQNTGTATGAAITAITRTDASPLSGGESTVRLHLTITGQSSGVETIEITPVDGSSIFDASGNAMLATETTGILTLNIDTGLLSDEQGDVIIRQNIINPRQGEETILNFRLDKRARVTITVYDLAGDTVKVLYNGTADPGMNEVSWDGKSRRGRPVVQGVYVIVVKIEKKRHARKVLVVK
jgi:hypothetical protein